MPAPPVVTLPLTVRALTPVVLTSIDPLVEEIEIAFASVNVAPEFTSIEPVSEVTPASICTLPLVVVRVIVPAAAAVTAWLTVRVPVAKLLTTSMSPPVVDVMPVAVLATSSVTVVMLMSPLPEFVTKTPLEFD